MSAVLADDSVMLTIRPGEHGSTFGGGPLASAVALEALKIIVEERLPENAARQGARFVEGLKRMAAPGGPAEGVIEEVRGRGLLVAVVVKPESRAPGSVARWNDVEARAWGLCLRLAELGLLAKPTHGNVIRFAPPLVINDAELDEALDIISRAFASV